MLLIDEKIPPVINQCVAWNDGRSGMRLAFLTEASRLFLEDPAKTFLAPSSRLMGVYYQTPKRLLFSNS